MRTSKVYSISDEDFKQLILNSKSFREALMKLNYCGSGRGYDIIKRRCEELNISTEHFNRTGNNNKVLYSLEEILVEKSTYQNNSKLKERLIQSGLLRYECYICGNKGVWQDKELALQLDHINGNHSDNRIENLRLLCPNCHSQTETYGSRQLRAKSRK